MFSDHAGGGNEKKKGAVSVKKRDGGQLHVTDGRIIHCKHLPCEVRIFLVEIFSWTDCGFLSHYIHLLMQACVNSGTLVQFGCQLLVQHYLSSEIKCLKHLKIKRYKQVIINVPVVTYSSGSCACRIFSSKMKASLQELVVIIL